MLRRRLMGEGYFEEEIEGIVDLRLPSRTLWAQGNLVKDSEGNYSIGNPEDYGCYFSWGNIEGHNIDEGYTFNSSNYSSTPGSSVHLDIDKNDAEHDAAFAHLGDRWRMPTKESFQELYENTIMEWTEINGINGWKFMKPTNHDVFIFFPAVGNCTSKRGIINVGTVGSYWSSSVFVSSSDSNSYNMYFSQSSITPQGNMGRYLGNAIRPIFKRNG